MKGGDDSSSEILKSIRGEVTVTREDIYEWLNWIISENLSFKLSILIQKMVMRLSLGI